MTRTTFDHIFDGLPSIAYQLLKHYRSNDCLKQIKFLNEPEKTGQAPRVVLIENPQSGETLAFSFFYTSQLPTTNGFLAYRKTKIESISTSMRLLKLADHYFIVEFNSGELRAHPTLELGDNVTHIPHFEFVDKIYRHVEKRAELKRNYFQPPANFKFTLKTYYLEQLNRLPSGQNTSGEGTNALPESTQYQLLVKDIFDFAFEHTGIAEGEPEFKKNDNRRVDIMFLLSRCIDDKFLKPMLKRFDADKLVVECKNSSSTEMIKHGVSQVLDYMTGIKSGALGIVCAREQPLENKKAFDNLKKTLRDYLANGKPILVLYDAELRALLDATTNDYCLKMPIDRNGQLEQVGYLIPQFGGLAWLQHQYDRLDC